MVARLSEMPLRFGLAVICLAIACRGRADRPCATIATPPVPANAAERTRAPLVFEPLAWDLEEAAAFERLEPAAMEPRSDTIRGYVTTPDQFHAAPGTIEVAHTVEPVIIFTPRPGWTGTAHYPTVGGKLDKIELSATLTPAAAPVALVALEQRLGPPDDRRTIDGTGVAGGLRMIWVRGGIWVVATADPDGQISVVYRTDGRPVTDIPP